MERCLNNFLPETDLLKDEELLHRVIKDHKRMRTNAGKVLRRRLEDARNERARKRQEMNSNAALSAAYLSSLKEKVGAFLIGSSNDAIGWKNIEEYGEVDRRSKMYESTEGCKVVDVAKWKNGETHLPNITERLTPKRPFGTFGVNSGLGGGTTAKRFAQGHNEASMSVASGGKSFSSRRTHGGGGFSGPPEPSRVPTITARQVQQAELDFAMLSYSKTHVPLEHFCEYDDDESAEFGIRRVFFFEFINLMKSRKSSELSFAEFIEVVHDTTSEEAMTAVKKYSKHDWAVGISLSLAEHIQTLWNMASVNGTVPVTFDVFTWLQRKNKHLEEKDLWPIFIAADVDRDERLNKVEFASIFSGKLKKNNFAGILPQIHQHQQQYQQQQRSSPVTSSSMEFNPSTGFAEPAEKDRVVMQNVADAFLAPHPPPSRSFDASGGRRKRSDRM